MEVSHGKVHALSKFTLTTTAVTERSEQKYVPVLQDHQLISQIDAGRLQ